MGGRALGLPPSLRGCSQESTPLLWAPLSLSAKEGLANVTSEACFQLYHARIF